MQTKLNGITMSYDITGTGPAVLLIHGFPLNRTMWKAQAGALAAAGFSIITPDLRGFGESETREPASIAQYADDLIALLDHLGIDRTIIGGMSMGGYILLDLLDRYPHRCAAACLIVTRSGADDDAGKARRLALADETEIKGAAVVADAFASLLFAADTPSQAPEMVAEVYRWMAATPVKGLVGGLLAMRERRDYTPVLGKIEIPTLVVCADQDRAIPAENSRSMSQLLKHPTFCEISGGGHLVNMEKAEEFNACLLRFLQKAFPRP